jgi:hypothetical protein
VNVQKHVEVQPEAQRPEDEVPQIDARELSEATEAVVRLMKLFKGVESFGNVIVAAKAMQGYQANLAAQKRSAELEIARLRAAAAVQLDQAQANLEAANRAAAKAKDSAKRFGEELVTARAEIAELRQVKIILEEAIAELEQRKQSIQDEIKAKFGL